LEAGVDILTISRLLGHASFVTTMIYLHVRQPHLQSTPSPLDWLPVRQLPGWLQDKEKQNDPKTDPPPNPPQAN
jgi:integrase/recombinase XerD